MTTYLKTLIPSPPSFPIEEWNQKKLAIDKQVETFNRILHESYPTDEEMTSIYQSVTTELNRLKELSLVAKSRQDELYASRFCFLTSNQPVKNLAIGTSIAKGLELAGFLSTYFAPDNSKITAVAAGIFCIGLIIDGVLTIYEIKIYSNQEEESLLARLSNEGIEHAEKFQSFLRKLQEVRAKQDLIQEIFDNSLKGIGSAAGEKVDRKSSVDLDKDISSCLNEYADLPRSYHREEVYSRIISELIKRLPSTDPLLTELTGLEPQSSAGEEIRILAEGPLPVSYLPSRSSPAERSWSEIEETGQQTLSKLNSADFDTQTIQNDSKGESLYIDIQRIQKYKSEVMERFHLRYNNSFFETPQGYRLSAVEGIYKIKNVQCVSKERETPADSRSMKSVMPDKPPSVPSYSIERQLALNTAPSRPYAEEV